MTPEALSPELASVAQTAIDASPFSLTQVWILLGASAVAYTVIEMCKRTFLAPERLAKRRATEDSQTQKLLMETMKEAGNEITPAHEQTVRTLRRKADDAVGAYMSKMGRVWLLSVAVGALMGLWIGWNPSASMGAAAGFVGAMLSKPLHGLMEWGWGQIRKRFPGGSDDDPKPRGGMRNPVDTSMTISG